jgi:hypothetical protein
MLLCLAKNLLSSVIDLLLKTANIYLESIDVTVCGLSPFVSLL